MSDQLRNKIQQWEASPPPGAWPIIADALQEVNAENKLALRLSNHEEMPPGEIWETVREQVNPASKAAAIPAPVIPMQPLYPYLFRYGAVAILIGLAAWIITGNPFWQKPLPNTQATIIPNEPTTSQPSETTGPSVATALAGNASQKVETGQSISRPLTNNLPARDPKYAKVHTPIIFAKETVSTTRMPAYSHSPALTLRELLVQKRNPRYIIVYSPSGEPVRLSTKIAPLFYAFQTSSENNTERNSDSVLQRMQQQLIRRPYIPDPVNHFDIIRLVDMLQQEQ